MKDEMMAKIMDEVMKKTAFLKSKILPPDQNAREKVTEGL